MHAVKLLQTMTEKSCPEIHQKRVDCLFEVVGSLIDCGKLWISALGRGIRNQTTAKHNIKKVDTLVGNDRLHQERLIYYRYLSALWIGNKKRPVIIIDWSPISGDCTHYFLRASVTGIGRTLTIYEEVHELKFYANPEIHKQFLNKLSEILPAECRPIVVTDAGFRNTWFSIVLQQGWDFIGRLRHNTFVQLNADSDWKSVKTLHALATQTPRFLGSVSVARRNPLEVNMHIVVEKRKGRFKRTRHGKKCISSNSNKYSKGTKEPWILVTSLKQNNTMTKKIVRLYKLRMQIEASFKDIKNKRYGFRLPESGTKQVKRLNNLILIAFLATAAVWLAGQVAINNKWHYQIQANTVRNQAVLSIAFIGLHVLRNLLFYEINESDLLDAITPIQNSITDFEDFY
jgi:hypothetical protein